MRLSRPGGRWPMRIGPLVLPRRHYSLSMTAHVAPWLGLGSPTAMHSSAESQRTCPHGVCTLCELNGRPCRCFGEPPPPPHQPE